MTIASTLSQVQYPCNGTTTQWAFGNKVFSAQDLVATLIDTLGNLYAFTGTGTGSGTSFSNVASGLSYTIYNVDVDGGCYIIFSAAPTSGWTLDLRSSIAELQSTSIKNQGSFLPELHEEFFDKATRMLQDLFRKTYTFGVHGNDIENIPWPSVGTPAQRANTNLGFGVTGQLQTSVALASGTLSASSIGSFLYPQTATEALVLVAPSFYQYVEGDIRRYGAVNGGTANQTAINSAFLVSAAGGSAVYIPPGNWGYSGTINTGSVAYGGSSCYGAGESSVLLPATGIDGLTFVIDTSVSGTQGSRFFRDFVIQGPSATASTNNGILIPTAGGRITGIQFSNLTIKNFATAVNETGAGGLWNSSFNDCFLYNNYQGYSLNGLVAVLNIRGGECETGGMTGAGTRYGVYAPTSSQQSLHLSGMQIYGYDIGISVAGVYVAIENCDVSNTNVTCVQIASESGQVSVRDSWLQLSAAGTALTGVQIADQGSAIPLKVTIDGNQLQGNANAGTIGVYCGSNQFGVTVTNNTIGSATYPFVTGISGIGPGAASQNLVCKFNSIYASTTAINLYVNAVNAEVGPNYIQNGTPLTFTGGTPTGLNFVQNNVPMRGTAVFAAATTAAVAFANAMPVATYQIKLSQSATSTSPPWWTSKAASGFTINFGANFTGSVDWEVSL
jgi:hypothetical protein